MNALVGQKAKASCSLLWLIRTKGTNDGCRKDGSDFASTGNSCDKMTPVCDNILS